MPRNAHSKKKVRRRRPAASSSPSGPVAGGAVPSQPVDSQPDPPATPPDPALPPAPMVEVHELVPQAHGGALRRGSPGNQSAGHRGKMRELADDPEHLEMLEAILKGPGAVYKVPTRSGVAILLVDGKLYLEALRLVMERGHGRAPLADPAGRTLRKVTWTRGGKVVASIEQEQAG